MFRTRRRKRVNWRVIANRCILSVLLGCANLFREFDCERTRKKHVFLLRVNLREFSILSRVYRCWKAVESSFLAHFPISFKRKRNSEFVAPISGRMSGDSLESWLNSWFIYARETAGRNRRSMETLFPRTFEWSNCICRSMRGQDRFWLSVGLRQIGFYSS